MVLGEIVPSYVAVVLTCSCTEYNANEGLSAVMYSTVHKIWVDDSHHGGEIWR
jgi:hypothetical protein